MIETIILIGNYPQDRQESMERFTKMLEMGFIEHGLNVKIWRPIVFFGAKFPNTASGFGKWMGYIDKWILFPIILILRTGNVIWQTHVRFHITDHSNSPYLRYLPKQKTSITCHDVLAIRGALGYADAYCPASFFGKILQKWILSNLRNALSIAAVSHNTLQQLNDLSKKNTIDQDWIVIHNAFNAPFYPKEPRQCVDSLKSLGIVINKPFILHVGSNLPRKNRKMLLDMVHVLDNRWNGMICYAGQKVDDELMEHAKKLGLQHRVVNVVKPDHDTLLCLYNSCEAFIFPSFSEGFGWPLIEAQACGTPVIASNILPMPEVSGGGAIHADPADPNTFAEAFLLLKNAGYREEIVRKGLENVKRFTLEEMVKGYLDLHGLSPIKLKEVWL